MGLLLTRKFARYAASMSSPPPMPEPAAQQPSPSPPSMVIAHRSYAFADMTSAQSFLAAANTSRNRLQNDLISYLQMNRLAESSGGTLIRSSTGRELSVYGYISQIFHEDREYLLDRDPTAGMFAETPWTTIWNGFPTTYVDALDSYFADQLTLGALFALQAGYQEYYLHGGGLIYLETTGDSKEPLRRGDRPLRWCFVQAADIIDQENGANGYILTQRYEKNPLLDHGIEFISFYLTDEDRKRASPTTVHGSKIIPVNLNPKHQKWWRSRNIPFNKIHDTLWELRDLVFSRTRAHFQGAPIIVDADISADAQKVIDFANMNDGERKAMSDSLVSEIANYNSGAASTFAPVLGFKLRRLEAANLPDPREDIMLLCSRLSHGTLFPVKMVLASTKGASDTEDQDIITFASRCQDIRNTWGYKHLQKMLLMGRIMGASNLRMQDEFRLPPPKELEWPLIRILTPRDAAFTEKTDVSIYREAWEIGRQPPIRIRRKFPADSSIPLAPYLAGKGRKPDGKSTDPQPTTAPATPTRGASAEEARAIANEEIDEREREKLRRQHEEEAIATSLAPENVQ